MKFKNENILKIADVLESVYQKSINVKQRFELAQYCEPFLLKKRLILIERDKIIQSEGTKQEDGTYSLKMDNGSYLELMNCECEVDCKKFDLETLEGIDISVEEMIVLKEVIS